MGRLNRWLFGASSLRVATAVLRTVAPVARLGHRVLVTRHADVVDVLRRQAEFSVVPVYDAKMKSTSGAFFLGMDDGPRYQRESSLARLAATPGDLPNVAALAGEHANRAVEEGAQRGTLDVVDALTREVPLRLVADYFGVEVGDPSAMRRWLRHTFAHLFFNPSDAQPLKGLAEAAAVELSAHVDEVIAALLATEVSSSPPTVLGRLVDAHRSDPGHSLGVEGIRRNINGIIIGAVDTTSKAAVHALRVILGRPKVLRGARAAAKDGDDALLLQYIFEALRFDPFNPVMFRVPSRQTTVGARQRSVGPDDQILVSPLSAMFDRRAFPEPRAFRTDRPIDAYLHFGHGLHLCFGAQINRVTLPAILRPLLCLSKLRPLGPTQWDAADQFPDRWDFEVAT